MTTELKLGRFGHHPDPAIDFCVEVEEIQSIYTDQTLGLRDDHAILDARIARAMQFRVGGTVDASVAKAILREIEQDRAA